MAIEKFDYAELAADADELLQEFGQNGFIRRQVPGNGPANNPGKPTTKNYSANLVIVDYSAYERDGTLILATDKRAYVSSIGLKTADGQALDEIKPTDKLVEVSGQIWTIVRAMPLSPAGTIVCYDVQVRG